MSSSAIARSTCLKTAAFTVHKLASSLFSIVETDDVFNEHPFIYVKFLQETLVIVDTGCGGRTTKPDVEVTRLREFIETWPVPELGGVPLNPGGERSYIIVCTHCHYDHILAVEQFTSDARILASANDPSFLAPNVLPQNTLCARLGLSVPSYTPELVRHNSFITGANDIVSQVNSDQDIEGLLVLHTPGHTPDSLALWDERTHALFVGDTVYEWEPIIFPPQGNIVQWFTTMDFLVDFVQKKNSKMSRRVLIHAGHDSSNVDALDVLEKGKQFVEEVVKGSVRRKDRHTVDGIVVVSYESSDKRFSLRCPERLVLEAREQIQY